MTRRDYRALLVGVGLLAASMLLVELLAFRLAAATLGYEIGMFVGLGFPAAVAFGAMWLGRRKATATGPELCANAAHMAALSGAAVVAGGIGLTWVSQKYAIDRAEPWHFAIGLVAFLLPGCFAGAAMGIAFRRGISVVGRAGFSEAVGAIAGCALLPLSMWLGVPRAILTAGIVFAASAFAFAWAGRRAEPHWAVIATLPLAVVALVAGDFGDPWMEVRIDEGRRTDIEHATWTDQGVIAAEKIERGQGRLQIDRNVQMPLPKKRPAAQKPRFDAVDLAYLIEGREPEKGPVLIVGSGGAREIDAALAYGHPRVDAIELHAGLFEVLSLERYATVTGHILSDAGRVSLYVGDGRAALRGLPSTYQRIVVLEAGRFDQAAPRLLSRHDRLFTREAFEAYLLHLRDDGTLLLRVPREGVHAAIAGAVAAIGGDPESARDHLVACAGGERAVLVVVPGELTAPGRLELVKRCRKSRLDVVLPLEEPRRGRRDQARLAAEQQALSEAVAIADPARDDRPFLIPPPDDLLGAIVETASAVVPSGLETARPAGATEETEPARPKSEEEPPRASAVGIAGLGLIAGLAAVVLGALWPPPRSRETVRTPLSLHASFVFLGAAVALCLFALTDWLLRVAGDVVFAWSFIIPVGLVGVGAGRLWTDTLERTRSRRMVMVALAIGLVWLLLLHVVGARLEGLGARPEAVRLGLGGALLLISGFLLGFPLAAGLRFVGEWDRAQVSWAWGMHHAGWGLGGGGAALLVHYVGVARLWPLGLAAFAFGAVLLTIGARKAPPARVLLRRR